MEEIISRCCRVEIAQQPDVQPSERLLSVDIMQRANYSLSETPIIVDSERGYPCMTVIRTSFDSFTRNDGICIGRGKTSAIHTTCETYQASPKYI